MHIHLINQSGGTEPPLTVNKAQPQRMVTDPQDPSREIYLQWDSALDDKGRLRQCPVCQSKELYVRKALPQMTGFVLILIAAAVAVGFYAADHLLASVVVLLTVVCVDLLIFFFAGSRLICYQCHTHYSRLPIARNQKPWDAPTAERYRQKAQLAVDKLNKKNKADASRQATGQAQDEAVPTATPPPPVAEVRGD